MIDPQQSGQRWELSPRINLGVLVNSMEETRVRLAPFAGRVVGAVVSSIDWGRVRLTPPAERIRGAFVSAIQLVRVRLAPLIGRLCNPDTFVSTIGWVRARLEPLVGRLRTVKLRSSRVAKVRIDVVGRIKAAAIWMFAMIQLGLLIALLVGAFLIYASTTKSALIS